ncbi:hypothetical protein [Thermococcus sp. 21S9]|uniref:hypothetical protein n=1 Tax=Thermococcus sp. 21S9 TaxID=1638223 RepID=UPI00143B9432|nr:hypothetical protein [Thermococcus sp. 21S9]NJE54894.1 hypothetical protein [Thermococcus sp. 21S9]
MEMNKKIIGAVVAVLILAGFIYWEYYYIPPVPKPEMWGYNDPPALINMSWKTLGQVEVINESIPNAGELYGKTLAELPEVGYSMVSGNWSNEACQWSYWTSRTKAYYIAYNGTRFLAIRGKPEDVLNATEEYWLCGKPLDSNPLPSPSPWKVAEAMAISLGNKFMENNVTISPANWTGPLPDWYLAKFSFRVNIGDGVEVLILVYSSEDQVKYAEYVMKKKDRSIKFLRNDGGDYYALIALKGRKADVDKAIEIIQKPGS